MDTIEAIKSRRSVRKFLQEEIPEEEIRTVLEAGIWAPSGMNNQPWKFVIVRDPEMKEKLGLLSKYGKIMASAPVCIAVFLDNNLSYDRVKDIQAIGACLQNMLLAAHSIGLGAVWIGEILRNKEKVRELLRAPEGCELMAVVAMGRPAQKAGPGSRRPLESHIIGQY